MFLLMLFGKHRKHKGAAEELGIRDEQDIVNMVKEVRAERDVLYRCE